MIRFRPIPDASAQMRAIPLVLTAGLDGWRVAFAAGEYYETVSEFPTVEQAREAYNMAQAARREIAR